MKSKILALILLAIAVSVILSLGYQVKLSYGPLEITNIKVSTYSGNNTRLSYLGYGEDGSVLSAVKGYLFSWYSQQPSEVLVLNVDTGDSFSRYVISSDHYDSQGFSVDSDYDITKISLRVGKKNQPAGDLLLQIKHSGDVIAEATYPGSDVPAIAFPDPWINFTFTSPVHLTAGEGYTFYIKAPNTPYSTTTYYGADVTQSDVYSGVHYRYVNGGSSIGSNDVMFRLYAKSGQQLSSFQISFDYSINSKYTVAYKSDLGKELGTFNYTINIYHNVDTNQSWVLAYSISYYNVTSFSNSHYTSPWISMLSGSYTEDYHDYYWKIEVVVNAYDSITGSTLSKSSYVILKDQFYWQSYADFNTLAELVDTNMNVETFIQPYSLILAIIVVITYFIINKRMMERD